MSILLCIKYQINRTISVFYISFYFLILPYIANHSVLIKGCSLTRMKEACEQKIDFWEHDVTIIEKNICDLRPNSYNPNVMAKEKFASLKEGLKRFGYLQPILIDSNGTIIDGEHRYRACKEIGLDRIQCVIFEDLESVEEYKKLLTIALNNIHGQNDEDKFAELIRCLSESYETDFIARMSGFDTDYLDDVLVSLRGADKAEIEDEVPICPEGETRVKPGDLITLDNHRLLCGDVTKAEDLEKLMGSDKADMCFTDPPYNVDYEGYGASRLKIQNDNLPLEEFQKFLENSFACLTPHLKPSASIYVCHSSSCQREFQQALLHNSLSVRNQIIWVKNSFTWGFGRYKYRHEPIFYCHKTGEKDVWYGDKTQSTVWEINKPVANKEHPTMKPIELIDIALRNSSKSGDLIVDPFGGSGSTLISSVKNNRNCRMLEIEPRYCDVIISRYLSYTDGKKIRINDQDVEWTF